MNDIFNGNRFLKLFRHQFALNSRLLLYGTIGYCGIIFLVLFVIQTSTTDNFCSAKNFNPLVFIFVIGFGVLYTGYSFQPFRSNESSISYLTLPASIFEKFILEFINRILLALISLPLFFWAAFNLSGYFFELIYGFDYTFLGPGLIFGPEENNTVSGLDKLTVIVSGMLILIGPFTGAAMFARQPLIKTFFSVTILFLIFTGLIYIIMEPLGLSNYSFRTNSWFMPDEKNNAQLLIVCLIGITNLILLVVAFLKIKEKEV